MPTITNGILKSWFADSTFVAATDAVPEALGLNPLVATPTPMPEGDSPIVRVPFVSSDPEAKAVAEGAPISEGEPALSELRFSTEKIGLIHRVSNETYRSVVATANGQNGAATQLTDSLRRSVTMKLDAELLTATDANGCIGLATHDAVTDYGQLATAAPLASLIDALAGVADHGGVPTSLVMSNGTWAKLLKYQYKDGRPVVNPDAQTAAMPVLLGLPVIRTASAPADLIIVTSASDLLVSIGQLEVATDASGDDFRTDSTSIRVLARIGWGIARAGRLAKVTVSDK